MVKYIINDYLTKGGAEMEDEKKTISTEETENNKEANEQQSSLDALLFDSDDSDRGNADDDIQFEAFMAEYRDIISKTLSEASEAKKASKDSVQEEEDESEFLISLPKKKTKRNKASKPKKDGSNEWDEEITLAPKEYADLSEESEIMKDQLPEEEFIPDFDLGEKKEEKTDKFQFSINFEGEQPTEEAEEEPTESGYDPEKPRAIDWVFDIAEMFVFVLVAVMILTTLIFKHSIVEGDSMNNTLENGDHLIISNLFYTPERGDIIVFEDYSTDLRKAVVKRVIALPNETVEIRLNSKGQVIAIVNGEELPEEYALNLCDADIDMTNFNKPITLGDDEIFVMGDNRYHSLDSRSSLVGPIKTDAILGKILFRFLPIDKFGAVE